MGRERKRVNIGLDGCLLLVHCTLYVGLTQPFFAQYLHFARQRKMKCAFLASFGLCQQKGAK